MTPDSLPERIQALIAQWRARGLTERGWTCDAEAELLALRAERDKGLDAFNRSEQFQNGPTKRAEAVEAALAHERDLNRRMMSDEEDLQQHLAEARAQLAEVRAVLEEMHESDEFFDLRKWTARLRHVLEPKA